MSEQDRKHAQYLTALTSTLEICQVQVAAELRLKVARETIYPRRIPDEMGLLIKDEFVIVKHP